MERSIDFFEISSGSWGQGADLGVRRRYPATVLLPDGKVAIVSGYDATGANASWRNAHYVDPLPDGVVDAPELAVYCGSGVTAAPVAQRLVLAGREDVRLSRREPRKTRAEAVDIVMGAGRGHVLHSATCRHERILEDGELAGPTDGFVEPAGQESRVERLTASRGRHCPRHRRTPP